jgi:hypothetical protein
MGGAAVRPPLPFCCLRSTYWVVKNTGKDCCRLRMRKKILRFGHNCIGSLREELRVATDCPVSLLRAMYVVLNRYAADEAFFAPVDTGITFPRRISCLTH